MHFATAVITKDGDYDSALTPFSEHIEVEPYLDMTREQLIAEKRKELEEAKAENNRNWLKFLLSAYEWADDDMLYESIKRRDLEDYSGYTYDERGDRYTTYNKNAKWDWYCLGGRFPDLLLLKQGKADEAQVKDIDFDAYKLDKETEAYYRRQWEIVVESAKATEEEKKGIYDNKKAMLTDYGTLDRYLKICGSFFVSNLLYKGKWYSADDSCICNDAEKNKRYQDKFFEIMGKLDPEDYISIIDCHI